jgi:hypothetical protein
MMSQFMTNLLANFKNPAGLDRPLMRDIARYQLYYNHDVARANGVEGLFVRCGISWGYHDPFFKVNYGGAKGKMYRSSYHVIYPDQNVVKQADQVWYDEHPVLDVMPRCMDLELSNDVYWAQIGDQAWDMSQLVFNRDGVRPIIYSRYKLIELWLRHWTPEMLNAHYWVLAQYRYVRSIEHAGPPTLPKYVVGGYGETGSNMIHRDQVLLHQTADKKEPFPGEVPTSGAGKSVDYDRWELGDTLDMHKFIAETWGEGSAPPDPPSTGDKVVTVTASTLNMRAGPGTTNMVVGSLKNGMKVTVVDVSGAWFKIGEVQNAWIHSGYVEDV